MNVGNFESGMPQQLPVPMRSRQYEFSHHREVPMMQSQFQDRSRSNSHFMHNSQERFHVHGQNQSGCNMTENRFNFDANRARRGFCNMHHVQTADSHSRTIVSERHSGNAQIYSPHTSTYRQNTFQEMVEQLENNNISNFHPARHCVTSSGNERHGLHSSRNRGFVKLPSSPPRHPELDRKQNASFFNKENIMLSSSAIQTKQFYARTYRQSEKFSKSPHTVKDFTQKKHKELELDAASILCNLGRIISNDEERSPARSKRTPLEPRVQTSPSLVSDGQDSLSSNSSLGSSSDNHHPTRLALPKDESELNSLHCFVRQELLEMFIIPEEEDYKISLPLCGSVSNSDKEAHSSLDTPSSSSGEASLVSLSSKTSPKKSSFYGGRVGFRCVHCAHSQPRPSVICTSGDKKSRVLDPEAIIQNSNAPMANFYPKSVSDLYRLVCTWQRVHFHKCRHIPPSVRNLYHKLKHEDRTRGKTRYWVASAREIGLADDPKGGGCVRFYPGQKDQ